ncbi:glycine rich nucleic binding domain [Teratosphaeria destructans]|uniref:Glycine rich nucleic binding domain n=1 Tax=Teratosphaeria destructans TaxID=418781 RepID=A0A9W7VY39_9PEZI|nr:glycine rich nucleic binding domain [Teratosphaeria destructans]
MSGPKKGGMSLYANLLGGKQDPAASIISGAPVKYDIKKAEEEAAGKKKDASSSLHFQPIRRPQVQPKNTRPKQSQSSSSSSAHKFSSSTASVTAASAPYAGSPEKEGTLASSTPAGAALPKSNFEDWVGDADEDIYYDKPKYERGGRKNKKKKNKGQETRVWDWDDIYDPTLPNNHADYKGSTEQSNEIRDWKARLYYHQLKETRKNGKRGTSSDAGSGARPPNRTYSSLKVSVVTDTAVGMFAPPSNLSFAPPSFDDPPQPAPIDDDDDDYYPPSISSRPANTSDSYQPPLSFAPASVPDDATGEDAFARRMCMSGQASATQSAPPAQPPATATPSAPPTNETPDVLAKKAEAQAKIAAFKAKIEAQRLAKAGNGAAASPTSPGQASTPPAVSQSTTPQPAQMPPPPAPPVAEQGVTVSRAPVRYQIPASDISADATTQEAPLSDAPESIRSNRPGQKGFAERLLKKYGWEKGQGLGASGEGITTAIVAKAEKRKKLSDSQGGGWAQPANMGKIVGGKKRKIDTAQTTEADAKFGQMSEVVKLEGMCQGMDLDHEIAENDLFGEIGKEMETQYGKVERLFIWRKEQGGGDDVFVKFTSQLSAVRCLNAADGMEFAGNEVKGRFFDAARFEAGEYE